MAVWNVSRKKSRAAIVRSPVWLRQTIVALSAMQDRRPVRRRVGVGDGAADRAPVADLRVADRGGHVVEERIAVADDRRLVDLAMGRPGADDEVVVGLGDAVEAGHVAQVDEQGRLGEPELDQREEAVAAGQQLGLAFAVLEDPQRLVQVPRTDVVELAGNHRAGTLLPAHAGAMAAHPARMGTERLATIAGLGRAASMGVTAGPSSGTCCAAVSVRGRSRVNVIPVRGYAVSRGPVFGPQGVRRHDARTSVDRAAPIRGRRSSPLRGLGVPDSSRRRPTVNDSAA